MKLSTGHYHGESVRTRRVAGFRLSETNYAPGLTTARHEHEGLIFSFVRSGSFTETCARHTREGRPQALLALPAGEAHHDRFDGQSATCFMIEVEPTALERLRDYAVVPDAPAAWYGGAPAWLAARTYDEFRRTDAASRLAVEGLILELLVGASRAPRPAPRGGAPSWLGTIREALHANVAETTDLASLARVAGVHPAHLARVFRRAVGCTVGEYVRRLRIEHASHELSTTAAPIAEIAAAAGFFDQSHFARTFKRATGLTPTEYRAGFRRR